jgi:DNA replication protein DnaC
MKTLDEIKEQIRNLGVKRFEYKPFVFETALSWFIDISNEILKTKKEVFDYESVKNIVDYIIKWTYPYKENDIEYRKGFLVKGKTGRGKSFLFNVWTYFLKVDKIKFSFNNKALLIQPNIVNVKKISGEYQNPTTGGYQIIEKYSKMNCLVLDDIGKEQELSKSFGNSINIVEEIINNREEINLLTFGTTNLDKLSDVYDDRTVSRMNKLFKAIPVNHDIDYRINPLKLK